jgi:hypothetical protein
MDSRQLCAFGGQFFSPQKIVDKKIYILFPEYLITINEGRVSYRVLNPYGETIDQVDDLMAVKNKLLLPIHR